MKRSLVLACIVVLIGGPTYAMALPVIDDFNDGIYSGWTNQVGNLTEAGGRMSGSDFSVTTFNGVSGFTIGVDAIAGSSMGYVALILNYSSPSSLHFFKLQDYSGDGRFDSVCIYRGNNGNVSVGDNYFFNLSSEVESSYFEASVDNTTGNLTAKVAATGDVFSVHLVNTYAGMGVGLGFRGNAQADNFYLSAVPEPDSMALLLGGMGLAHVSARRRAKVS